MTSFVFGQKDQIAFVNMQPAGSSLGIDIVYSHPSDEEFYSRFGYANEISHEGIPYAILMEDDLPETSQKAPAVKASFDYLLVDHQARVWLASLGWTTDGKFGRRLHYVHRKTDSWWMNFDGIDNESLGMIIGFLHTQPSREAIDAFWQKYQQGRFLTWMSVEAIAEKLNKDYPSENDAFFEEMLQRGEKRKEEQKTRVKTKIDV